MTSGLSAQAPKVTRCRVCGNPNLIPCFDTGDQYLSSIFPENLDYRKKLFRYPMDMVLCQKGAEGKECGLVQLGHDLDLSAMYDDYPYTSSSNSSMKRILQDVAESGKTLNHLKKGDIILDIGCNDGTLLSNFMEQGYQLVGIDAAKNIAPVVQGSDLKIVQDFFSKKAYLRVAPKKARLIYSIAMFYHLSDPVSFCRDAADCLEDDGVWIVQMAYLSAMIRTNMYDNIVHEHAGYYGIQHMQWVVEKAGLEIFDVLLNDVYGGSFRVFVKKKGFSRYPATARLAKHLAEEQQDRIFDLKTYQDFDRRVQKTKTDLLSLIQKIKKEGKSIWVYGASTKGNTIMQYCGLTSREIDAAADANPFKPGKYMIGCDVPIKDEETMRRAKPDYLLSLPYSFTDGFIRREEELIRQGTRFIVPLPNVLIKP